MNRRAFVRDLEEAGCVFLRHGKRHDVDRNRVAGDQAPVPLHREISDTLCKTIRRQLGLVDGSA